MTSSAAKRRNQSLVAARRMPYPPSYPPSACGCTGCTVHGSAHAGRDPAGLARFPSIRSSLNLVRRHAASCRGDQRGHVATAHHLAARRGVRHFASAALRPRAGRIHVCDRLKTRHNCTAAPKGAWRFIKALPSAAHRPLRSAHKVTDGLTRAAFYMPRLVPGCPHLVTHGITTGSGQPRGRGPARQTMRRPTHQPSR
jgi:hypothetical protein